MDNKQEKPIIVMKFGGSCLKTNENYSTALQIIQNYSREYNVVCVVSALQGITSQLIEVTHQACQKQPQAVIKDIKKIENRHYSLVDTLFGDNLREANAVYSQIREIIGKLLKSLEEVEEFGIVPYFIDYIMSFGEKLACSLLHYYLVSKGWDSELYFGEDLIITNNKFNNALPDLGRTKNRISNRLAYLKKQSSPKTITCITGFIGRNKIGYTTTLGRGGSDYTATILARCFEDLGWLRRKDGGKVILWKDVPGILSGNPIYLKSPQVISQLTYTEAKAIAELGAKVLHPNCLAILEQQLIPVEIKKFQVKPTSDLDYKYTVISNAKSNLKIKGICILDNYATLVISSPTLMSSLHLVGQICEELARVNLKAIIWSESLVRDTISLLVFKKDIPAVLRQLKLSEILPQKWVSYNLDNIGIISVIVDKRFALSILQQISSQLEKSQLFPLSILFDPSNASISFLVTQNNLAKTANCINKVCEGCQNASPRNETLHYETEISTQNSSIKQPI